MTVRKETAQWTYWGMPATWDAERQQWWIPGIVTNRVWITDELMRDRFIENYGKPHPLDEPASDTR